MTFSWRDEFPDYPQSDMPALPSNGDWCDTSWHNNACPSYTSDALGLHLWIDFPDDDKREHPGGRRFMLEEQDHGIETGKAVIETDRWDDVVEAIRLYGMDATTLNDWYEQRVGYRPQVDDRSMTDADLRSLCCEYLQTQRDEA